VRGRGLCDRLRRALSDAVGGRGRWACSVKRNSVAGTTASLRQSLRSSGGNMQERHRWLVRNQFYGFPTQPLKQTT
jgi:hypothetical protein